MDLVAKFWNFCHTLRHEGIDYSDYIEELTYLLFLKIASEKDIDVPTGCTWADLIVYDQEDLLLKYNEILTTLSKQDNILGDIFRQPIAKIRSSSSLKKLLKLIDETRWSGYNEDVLGSMFEGLIEKAATESKKGAGQYFTPRPLIDAIVSVVKPNPFESTDFKISDVACGTAGFLISSYEWYKRNGILKQLSAKKKLKLLQETYYGQELVIRPRRMAQMNLYLHGIVPQITLGDTIYEPLKKERFSCILTNPPFGTKGANQVPERSDFTIKTSNKQLNFVQHVYSCLQNGGRAAVVLPDNVLFEDKATEVWQYLVNYCNIHTILKLPHGTFTPYANVKANVVFFQKGQPTEATWIYDARSNVGSITKNSRPLSGKYFDEFISCYGDDPNGRGERKDLGMEGRFRKFSVDVIKSRGYKFDINWLKDESGDTVESTTNPKYLLLDTIAEFESIIDELKAISNLLESDEE